jgi:putative transposase
MSKRKYWTAEEKLQAILYVDSAESVTQACRELGIDPSMYYKWKKTYEEKGEEGLQPKYPKKDPEVEKLRIENERLKKLLAEKTLELELAQEFIKKTLMSRGRKQK